MNQEAKKLLFDALVASRAIQSFIESRTFEEYLQNDMLRSAVERKFEIIGEALNQAASADEEAELAVPDLPKIVGLRNRLIHAYASVNNAIIWAIVHENLPELVNQIEASLA
jgi:uncharacterized protein with HEPN domain